MADAHRWRVSGLAITALGALLVVVSFTVLDWYDDRVLGRDLTFASLRADVDALQRPGYSLVYFDWLAWLALVLAVAFALGANRRTTRRKWRIAAAGFGVLAAAGTYLALWSLFAYAQNSGAKGVGVFEHANVGVYLALAGFLVIGAGALVP